VALPTVGDLITAIVARYHGHAAAGPVMPSRSGSPAITAAVTDALVGTIAFSVQITAGDAPGPATYKWSQDGGTTWSAPAAVPEGGSASPIAGLTIGFPAPPHGVSYQAGDRYNIELYGTTPVTSIIGEQGESENTTPPKLVWVPGKDTFGPAKVIGPHPQGRSRLTRHAGVACHVWCAAAPSPTPGQEAVANLTACERMLTRLVWTIDEELRVGTAPDGNTWRGDGCSYETGAVVWQTAGTLMQQGCECVAEFVFDVPIAGPAPVSVRPLTFALQQSFGLPT